MKYHIVPILRRIVPITALILIIIELFVTNELAGLRDDVGSLEKRAQVLEEENDILAQEVASGSALTTVASKAQAMGFRQPKVSEYMAIGQDSVALNNSPTQ